MRVVILDGIHSDENNDGVWTRARYTLEDALKTACGLLAKVDSCYYQLVRLLEAMADDLWNMYAISRNENNESFDWPLEKRLLLGFHIIRLQ